MLKHGSILLFVPEEYSIVWIYHRLFIHSPVKGHLCDFQVLAITDKAIRHLGVGFCVDIRFLTHLGINKGVQFWIIW